MKPWIAACLLAVSSCVAGTGNEETAAPSDTEVDEASDEGAEGEDTGSSSELADVTGVTASGQNGSLSFSVTITSPDSGCDLYADWWEVVSEDGSLLYRRILAHSHVDEQPFTRSGGPVDIDAGTTVFVRAHLAPGGYGGAVMVGSVDGGFEVTTDLAVDFAANLESVEPLPTDCAF